MAGQSHVVVISVPIADTIKVIQEVGPFVSEHGLLMDLTSLKKASLEAMLDYSSAEVLGAHPLFGPEEKPPKRRTVAICPGRGETGMKWLTGVLKKAGIKVLVMDPEEHDRKMGLIQGVNHFSTLALALCISQSGFRFEDIMDCSTHTFRRRLDRIRSIMMQPPELFESLLMDNPQASEYIEQYRRSVEGLIRITRDGDRKAFEELFESLKKFFNT
jgi:prephenate dehydrogenase